MLELCEFRGEFTHNAKVYRAKMILLLLIKLSDGYLSNNNFGFWFIIYNNVGL